MAHSAAKGRLMAVIGDEDTCTGFLLGGIGELNKHRNPNFFVVDKNTSVSELEEHFKNFVNRDDIAIVLINQNIAEMIRHTIDMYDKPIPAVLEIPSKDHPYDASKDSILRRAKGMFNPDDCRKPIGTVLESSCLKGGIDITGPEFSICMKCLAVFLHLCTPVTLRFQRDELSQLLDQKFQVEKSTIGLDSFGALEE